MKIFQLISAVRIFPKFIYFVFSKFPSATIAIILTIIGVTFEYAALSVVLLFSGDNKEASLVALKVMDYWRVIAENLNLRDVPQTWLWIFLLLLGMRIAIGVTQTNINTWVSKKIMAKLSAETFTRVIIDEPLAHVYEQTVGHYITLSGDEAVRIGQVFFHLAQTLSAFLAAVIGLIVLWMFSPLVFEVTIIFLTISGICIGLTMRKVFALSNESLILSRETNTTFIEGFNGIRSIRSMGGEKFVADRYKNVINRHGRVLFLLDAFNHGYRSIPGLILVLVALVFLYPTNDYGENFTVVYFFTVTTMLIRILAFMGSVVASGGRAIIDMRGINDLNEILAKKKRKYDASNKRIISSIVEISINCLYCGYVKNNPILNNINAKLVAGRSYALNGKSGAGKSTFCDVMLGMLDPISGEILIGENPYSMVDLTSLRRKIVLVEQQTRIFSGSLKDNITLGFKASKNDLQIAINCAGLTEFIQSLERGLETRLDYQGANLSGGQRQRIGIARAILRNPDVLILDEATSALDMHTRNQIVDNIKKMFCEKILLFISHDSFITNTVDEVWHIKDGILVVEKNS